MNGGTDQDLGAGEPAASGVCLLALDAGSPAASVALAVDGGVRQRSFPGREASTRILGDAEDLLAGAGKSLADVTGLVAVRGPGSFTGLRITLATALGLHQALGCPATTVTTFEALAAQGGRRAPGRAAIVQVDALRGECFVQRFGPDGAPRTEAELRPWDAIAGSGDEVHVGFDLAGRPLPADAEILAAEPLAADALAWLGSRETNRWDAASLCDPLYLRPPAASPPRRR